MENLSTAEKFLLAHIWYGYSGRIYFSRGSSEAEEFLAEMLAEEMVPRTDRKFLRLKERFKDAIKKLQEYWMIEISSFALDLTSYGQQVVKELTADEYKNLWKAVLSG